MAEADKLLPETFLNSVVRRLVPVEVFLPEADGAFGNGVCRRRDLSRAYAAGDTLIGERGHHRARLSIRVRIVEMVVSIAAIEQHCLLDHALAQYFCAKVNIFLGRSGAQSDVMES